MKRAISIFILLIIFLVGCTNENTPNNDNNENVNADQVNNEENETLGAENENTFIDKEVVETSQEINIGESAFIIYPESDFTEEKKVEFIVHGVDYLSQIDIEGPSANERFDYLVLDFEIKNIGEKNILPAHHYPKLIIHNSAGHQSESNLTRGNEIGGHKMKSHTFEYADLIPGGHSRGLSIIALEEGEEIASLFFDTKTHNPDRKQPPFELNLDEISKTATETALQTYEQLEIQREAFLTDFFSDYDSKVVSISRMLGDVIISNLNLVQLTTEPEEFKAEDFQSLNQTVDYYAEFIRDENGRITGVRFTRQ